MRAFWVVLLGVSTALVPAGAAQARSAPAPSMVSITVSAPSVTAEEKVVISGRLSAGAVSTAERRLVLVARNDSAGSAFHSIVGATTTQDGRYVITVRAELNWQLYVSFAGTADLGASRSAVKSLQVRMRTPISVTPNRQLVFPGELRSISGTVSRELKGRFLDIQARTSTTGWRTVSRVEVVDQYGSSTAGGYFRWSYRFSRPGVMVFRVVYPAIRYQAGNVSRNASFSVERWHLLKDLTPSATTGGLAVTGTHGRLGSQTFPNSLKLARSTSAGSVSYDLKGGCSAFAGAPVVYRGAPRDHPVRFLLKLDGTAAFDGTFRLDKQLSAMVTGGKMEGKRTLELVVAGPGTGLVDLWSGAQILCSW